MIGMCSCHACSPNYITVVDNTYIGSLQLFAICCIAQGCKARMHARMPILRDAGVDEEGLRLFMATSQVDAWCAMRCRILLCNFIRGHDTGLFRNPLGWWHKGVQEIAEQHKSWWQSRGQYEAAEDE